MNTLDLTADTINVTDIIERFEELERETGCDDEVTRAIVADESLSARRYELKKLEALLDELAGEGGDEQWQGNWYPSQLISENCFADYAKQMLEDCGDIPRDLPSYIEIDWEGTAKNLLTDYTLIDIDGATYYFR